MDPGGCLFDQIGPFVQKGVEPEMSQLVSARRHEQRRAERPGFADRVDDLEPARNSATTLGGTVPPTAAGRHHDDRGQILSAARYRRDNVAGACAGPGGVSDDRY